MSELWPDGVGRIRREPYQLFIGDTAIDMDEVRTHCVERRLQEPLQKLNPPLTAAECVWLADFIRGFYPGTQIAFLQMLMQIVDQPCTIRPSPWMVTSERTGS